VNFSASTTAGLGCLAQQGPGGGRAIMNARKVGAPSGAVVASMVGLVRASHQSNILKMGWRIVVEVTSGACTQGAIFGFCRESALTVVGAQGPFFCCTSMVVL
jgi:hypothetical protein